MCWQGAFSRHISDFAWVSPPVQTTVFTKVSGVGLVTGVLTVKFVLILSTGVLQTQAGMEGSK